MSRSTRVLVLLFVLPATYLFIYWIPFSLLPLPDQRWIPALVALAAAIGVGRYLWKRLGAAGPTAASTVLSSGFIVGGVAFCAGFFGPMIFAPGANQGPLLGLLITGPAGFIVGLVGGFVFWRMKRRAAGRRGASGPATPT
ncbi:MAG: hypothetical protein Q8W51_09760 [Candidatus Palauibacterales bacterium]|nr:hypothetical protein [Candidatus Palauibacterales bacterium]MDP2530015.1 hypothetical protein [Candidatus Palauibacterales bacterium]MDP2585018.1 hypothetical protein [Candidatus Palauibacterales bacterium]